MPTVEIAIGLFDKCLTTLGLIRDGKRKRDEQTDQAIFALYAALNETRSYSEKIKEGGNRNRKTEYAIALLWEHASVPLRHIDSELAHRCFAKGNYWMEPDVWSPAQIRRKKIAISQMLESTRRILLNK